MSIVINTKTYSAYQVGTNAVTYAGPNNTVSSSDVLKVARVLPKPQKDFAGVMRPSAKLSRDVVTNEATGTKAVAILELSGSIPVGITPTELDSLIDDLASTAAATFFPTLVTTGQINY
jgi:hypothetical protein